MPLFKRQNPTRRQLKSTEKLRKYEWKENVQTTAFQNGMNPNAPIWGGIASLGQSAASIFGGGSSASSFNADGSSASGSSSNLIFIVLAAVAAFFLIKK